MVPGYMEVLVHTRPPAALRMLLVEDDAGDVLIVEELLAAAGLGGPVEAAGTIADAAERLRSGPVDCVLLDLHLPDAHGLEALRRVREVAPDVPIVVLTGMEDEALGAAAVAAGAQDYLPKGEAAERDLARAVRYAVERRRAERAELELRATRMLMAENQRLERGLLPVPLVACADVEVVGRLRPGRERTLLGGDFYDVVERDGTLHVVVGDVCGHGPDEAALGAQLRVAWRSLVLHGAATEHALSTLQALLRAEAHTEDLFVTACTMEVEIATGTTRVRLAGHPAPLVRTGGGRWAEVSGAQAGLPLGPFDDARWAALELELGRGWELLLYTDGIIEGLAAPGVRLGTEGLLGLLDEAAGVPAGTLPDHLLAAAAARHGGALPDDAALLLLRGVHGGA
jgi:serine phosphatase RsbU (regulator of sigma subunit)